MNRITKNMPSVFSSKFFQVKRKKVSRTNGLMKIWQSFHESAISPARIFFGIILKSLLVIPFTPRLFAGTYLLPMTTALRNPQLPMNRSLPPEKAIWNQVRAQEMKSVPLPDHHRHHYSMSVDPLVAERDEKMLLHSLEDCGWFGSFTGASTCSVSAGFMIS